MNFRTATFAALIAAISGWGASTAIAQQAPQDDGGLALIAASVDCRYQLRPVETEICSTPVLAAMDIQMVTLYNVLNQLVKPDVGVSMAAAQQMFLRVREACSSDGKCIGETYARRIGELDDILRDLASRGPY